MFLVRVSPCFLSSLHSPSCGQTHSNFSRFFVYSKNFYPILLFLNCLEAACSSFNGIFHFPAFYFFAPDSYSWKPIQKPRSQEFCSLVFFFASRSWSKLDLKNMSLSEAEIAPHSKTIEQAPFGLLFELKDLGRP